MWIFHGYVSLPEGIFPANWWITCHRSHLIGEPEPTIDEGVTIFGLWVSGWIFQEQKNMFMANLSVNYQNCFLQEETSHLQLF